MNIYLDAIFAGDHQDNTIAVISLIAENNETFYVEITDCDKSKADDWFKENVEDFLLYKDEDSNILQISSDPYNINLKGTRDDAKIYLNEWLSHFDDIQIITNMSNYDMSLVMSTFIDILDLSYLPNYLYPWCRNIKYDISSYLATIGKKYQKLDKEKFLEENKDLIPNDYPIEGNKHNSLYNAKVLKAVDHALKKILEIENDKTGETE